MNVHAGSVNGVWPFKVLGFVDATMGHGEQPSQAIILTGTAGDGEVSLWIVVSLVVMSTHNLARRESQLP